MGVFVTATATFGINPCIFIDIKSYRKKNITKIMNIKEIPKVKATLEITIALYQR